ncbi:hypothetical protein [Phytomonospora endophytica]|uniref:Ferric iron reductase FhuF-like transporter n=1 Tax=Phytomonospora endophytica TaxID=714109 RepID=A0A841FLW3_9ACTN|nr:hypothetical protein [Phytomonospora endophytica]MBB6034522.1 hypothetical protein [Phytomonospora endophytica]GIG70430.1 hypothetical protein Pen01_67250 [Phytomonospora endophytica]
MTVLAAPPTLAERIAAQLPFPAVMAVPDGEGEWVGFDDLLTGDAMRGQFARLAERAGAPAEVQVTHVVGWLAAAVINPLVVARRTAGVVPLLDPAETMVRCDPGGWFNAVAIGDPTPATEGDLDAVLLRHLTELFAPVVAFALPHSRLGRRTIWAVISDRVVQALYPADPADPGVHEARTGLEALFAGCGPLEQRRRWTSVVLPAGREALAPVAAACCLSYKSDEGVYCERVCPKTTEAERAAEIREFCTGK